MSWKIYFCGSIRGGRADAELYGRIIDNLKTYGTVFTEHVGSDTKIAEDKELNDKQIHDRDLEWLVNSDVVVAEVTQPSLGVGYELGRAIAMKKKILCLFRRDSEKRLSAMIEGAQDDDTFIVKHYEEKEYPEILKQYFNKCQKEHIDS